MENPNDLNDIYKNIEPCNPNKNLETLISLDDMIADMLINKRFNPIVIELFFIKLMISIVFITQSYFPVPKNIRLRSIHYFIMKIRSKWELQEIAFNYSSDIVFNEFMNFYKKCTVKRYSFSVINFTFSSDNPSCSR